MLNIYYGRESIDKEKCIYGHIKNNGGNTVVIVPDQYTLEAEKQAFRLLDTKGLLNVEILSMSRLGDRLLSEQGGDSRTFVNKYGRHMLLTEIAEAENNKLEVFKGSVKKNSFIELLNNFISEMKQYDTGPDTLARLAETLDEDSILRKKLQDINIIFTEYEKRIEGRYTDSEDYIDFYRQKIKTSQWIKSSTIWVYGFDSFAPKAMDVLGALMAAAEDVNIFLTYDRDCRDEDLFRLSGIVMKNLEAGASERGIEYREYKAEDEFSADDRAEGIRTIEKELYAIDRRNSSDFTGITVVEAANMYNEAESAASYILHLLRDEGLRCRDIVVICNDQDTRGSVISRTFEEYGIKLFDDRKRSITSSLIAVFVTGFIEIINSRYSTPRVLRLLKTGFTDFTSEEIEKLENYTYKYRIRGTMWKKPFTKGAPEYGNEGLAEIENIRKRAADLIEGFEKIYNDSKTVSDFIKGYYDFITDETDLPRRINDIIKAEQEQNYMDIAAETAQIWNLIVGLFDQINEISGDRKFKGKDFLELLTAGLAELEVGVLPPTADDIMMGTMQRTRTGNVKAVLVLGANEGLLPSEPVDEGLFSMDEIDYLAGEGTDICKTDSVRGMEEKLAIYRNLSKAEQHLWISYAVNNTDGEEQRPSEIIDYIREIFPDLKLERDVLNKKDQIELIGGKINTLRHMTEEFQKMKKGEKIDGIWKHVYDWYRENDRESLERVMTGLNFTNRQQGLKSQTAEALFKKENRPDLYISPSQLETFSRCPFLHYVNYGLKPDELRVYEAGGREIGEVYHDCLMKIAEKLTQEDRWDTVTEDELHSMINDILRDETESYREGVFSYTPEEKYKMKRLTDTCDYVCRAMVAQVRAGVIEKSMFEVPFGRNSEVDPVEVDLNGKTICIEGRIDRVDALKNNRVKIIDYKTGCEKFDLTEVKTGYRLQLMIYLKAAQGGEKKPGGVFYFLISNPQIDLTSKNIGDASEAVSEEMKKAFRMDGIMVSDEEVIRDIAGEFDGSSDVVKSLRRKKDGTFYAGSEKILLTDEEFAELQHTVDVQIEKLCRGLADGVLDIHPKKSDNHTPCEYCGIRGICRFDLRYPGCRYEIVK